MMLYDADDEDDDDDDDADDDDDDDDNDDDNNSDNDRDNSGENVFDLKFFDNGDILCYLFCHFAHLVTWCRNLQDTREPVCCCCCVVVLWVVCYCKYVLGEYCMVNGTFGAILCDIVWYCLDRRVVWCDIQ